MQLKREELISIYTPNELAEATQASSASNSQGHQYVVIAQALSDTFPPSFQLYTSTI